MTTTEIALRHQPPPPASIEEIKSISSAFVASGFFKDCREASQAFVKIMAGRELGVQPFAAITGIHLIEGKPGLSSNLIGAKVKSSGKYDYRVIHSTNDGCLLEFYENGKKVGPSEFLKKDAEAAGLSGRGTWSKYPKAMFFARALTQGVRTYCPDVIAGVVAYTPEELGADVNEDGEPTGVPPLLVEASIVEEAKSPAEARQTIPEPIVEPAKKDAWKDHPQAAEYNRIFEAEVADNLGTFNDEDKLRRVVKQCWLDAVADAGGKNPRPDKVPPLKFPIVVADWQERVATASDGERENRPDPVDDEDYHDSANAKDEEL